MTYAPESSVGSIFILLKSSDEPIIFDAKINGEWHVVGKTSYKVKITDFYHSLKFDDANKPLNVSDEPANPAIVIQLKKDDISETRYLFSKFPHFHHSVVFDDIQAIFKYQRDIEQFTSVISINNTAPVHLKVNNMLFIIFKNKKNFLNFFRLFLLLNSALIAVVIFKRWLNTGYAPLTNLFETFILMFFLVSLIYFFITFKIKSGWLNFSVLILIILMFAFMSQFLDASIKPLMPALKSNWLTVHVFSYMLSYSFIAISFVISVIVLIHFLTKNGEFNPANTEKFTLSNYNYTLISLSFPLLNIGLFTGAIWAKQAWGDYWSWDPKETWALICWIYYLNYFHLRIWLARLLKNNSKKIIPVCESLFLIFGFFLILFTYFGLKSQNSLHSFYK